MALQLKLGKLPAVPDNRIPYLSELSAASTLPPPPPAVNFYAGVGDWRMLGNDQAGDCVEAMIGHATMQFTSYAGKECIATTREALALYSTITGYDPNDPSTDNGTVMLGPNGAVEYWKTQGVVFGDVKSFCKAMVKVKLTNLTGIKQTIHYFGGIGLGFMVPQSIMDNANIPFMWNDPSGPFAGGHEVWVDGYETVAGKTYFDFITWGMRCRMSEDFLNGTVDEIIGFYDLDSLNARGLNPDDFNATELLAIMQQLKRE